MIQPVLEVARSLSSPLNRLAAGFLTLYYLLGSGEFPVLFAKITDESFKVELSTLPQLVIWFILSALIGSFAVEIGAALVDRKYSERSLLSLAMRVEKNGSEILLGKFRDALSRFELASGLIGAIGITLSIIIWNRILSGTYFTDNPSKAAQALHFSEAIISVAIAIVLRHTATTSLKLIESIVVLDLEESEKAP